MKKIAHIIAGALCLVAAQAHASELTLGDIAGHMAAVDCYADTASYEVLLASLSQPVSYSVRLASAAAESDSLSPCRYFIRWTMATPTGSSEGFSAYFDGSHFRYRDKRLQEYHAAWNPEPFAPGGKVAKGVQRQVQFAELLPAFIALHFTEMASDSSYATTIEPSAMFNGRQAVVVKGVRRIAGYDCAEYRYVLDATTLLPLRIELETNPGQIGEQSIAVTYGHASTAPPCAIDLATVMAAEGEAFEKYRESTFSLETLPGRPLPEIAAPTTTGERYFHARGSGFAASTVLVFVDSAVDSTPQVVEAVRYAVSALPLQLDVVWAFLDHRADDVEAIIARPEPGEHLLMHAGGAARDCGIGSVTPVLVFADRSGTVRDFIVGFNKDLASLVIQKAMIID